MAKTTYKIIIDSYTAEWIEQARQRLDRGLPVDDGTLITIATLLMDGIQ